MTEDEKNNAIIDLYKADSGLANGLQELLGFLKEAKTPAAIDMLTVITEGFLSIPSSDNHPFLTPLSFKNPGFIWHGDGSQIPDLHGRVEFDGSVSTVWRNTSFIHRFNFLAHGLLTLNTLGKVFPAARISLNSNVVFRIEDGKVL